MKRASKKKKTPKPTAKKADIMAELAKMPQTTTYDDIPMLPPKPGEPETWVKIVAERNRFVTETAEDINNAFETMRNNFDSIKNQLGNLNAQIGMTPYEREYLKPMLDQVMYYAMQLMEVRTAMLKKEVKKIEIRKRKPTTAKEVSESLEVMSGDVNSILGSSTWTQKFFKKSSKDKK